MGLVSAEVWIINTGRMLEQENRPKVRVYVSDKTCDIFLI